MLHGVDDEGSVLSVTADELAGLVRAIRGSGHDVVLLGRLLEEPEAPDRVALTFDDGFASVAEVAAPILRRAGVPATLFLTTGHVGGDNRWPSQPRGAPMRSLLSWPQVKALVREGWEIGSHSQSHPDLCRLSDAELAAELDEPQREIAERVGRRPELFAYPYGNLDDRVAAAVGRRYRFAVTTRMATLTASPGDPHRLPRIDVYYLRRPAVHWRFGTPSFALYLRVRALLRGLRSGGTELS